MDPLSPLPAIGCLLIAFITSWAIGRKKTSEFQRGRYETIDGLRGYLAVCVYIHHASIWYFYLRTGRWEAPPSNLYNHFGQSSVAMFFMVTGFLFFSKLIDKDLNLDWARLYVSRFLRLAPLYLVMVLLLVVVSFAVAGFELNQEPVDFISGLIDWIGFTVRGAPDLNGLENTYIAVAGVTWSLPYEWCFYFSLPFLSFMAGRKSKIRILMFCGFMMILMLVVWKPGMIQLKSFLGGIAAALLVKSEKFRFFASGWKASFVLIACIGFNVIVFRSVYSSVPLIFLGFAFSIIACGNSIFGMLANPVSRVLGEMAYGIYLIHGLLLFGFFKLIFGFSEARDFSPVEHWIVVLALAPVLIFLGFFAHRYIEYPSMQKVDRISLIVAGVLRKLFSRRAVRYFTKLRD